MEISWVEELLRRTIPQKKTQNLRYQGRYLAWVAGSKCIVRQIQQNWNPYPQITSPLIEQLVHRCNKYWTWYQYYQSYPSHYRATLLTDGLIGAMVSPHCPSTSYVLLHHMMGGVEGEKGVWAYPQGGMGAVSQALAQSARSQGAQVFIDQVRHKKYIVLSIIITIGKIG